MSILGDRIKKERENLNLSREQLANKIGVSYSAIAMYEQGNREPNNTLALKMCEIFDCSLDYLIGKSKFRTKQEEIKNIRETFYKEFGVDKNIFNNAILYPKNLTQREFQVLKNIYSERDKYHKNNNGKFDIVPYLSSLNKIEKNHVTEAYNSGLISELAVYTTILNSIEHQANKLSLFNVPILRQNRSRTTNTGRRTH